MALTDKQERFCEEYLVDLNITAAMIRAGYSESYAKDQGYKMSVNVGIQNKIAELKKASSERLEIDADKLTAFFQSIMNNEESRDTDRIKAAENLGKRIGYYEEDNKQRQLNIPIEKWLERNSE